MDTFRAHSGHSALIKKEPLIPRDQSQISVERSTGPRLVELGEIVNPEGIRTIGDFPNITAAMERAGWDEPRIRKIMGENWLCVLADAWGEDSS